MSERFDKIYDYYVDKGYEPNKKRDIIAVFRITPAEGYSIEAVAGGVAAESSTGTWTTLYNWYEEERWADLSAKAYDFHDMGDGSWIVKIAYPFHAFEEANLPGLLASIAGNVFGMRRAKALRLEDMYLPEKLIREFDGPAFGIEGVRKMLEIKDRPIYGVVPKPKVGYSPEEFEKLATELLLNGADYMKDDENLTSPWYNRFEERAEIIAKIIDKVENETGEKKTWFANITANLPEMEERLEILADLGLKHAMVDVVITGWGALQYIRDLAADYGLAIHGHRAMHATFTRNPYHGISMFVLAKLYRLIGIDQLHVGTAGAGKLEGGKWDVIQNARIFRESHYKPDEDDVFHLEQKFYGIKAGFPTSSGGLHPGNLPIVFDALGTDLVIQLGGGTLGHPDGPAAGARAVRQAIDAYMQGIPLEEYAKTHKELARALEKWGHVTPV
ncbi:type III ribulose-bisphosphate carboxylase [Thermococcus thioreducens]|uniref:Ribulose bisphosphate carboxylase n=1 Tax=Thermococcus thioreducens TaxID=277988 RepID=A0A0Q2RFW6_9EURY|nr:type III ribulose-bisphosphate carboxylase [Thermococcus thioreducens]ASJ13044.1 type III ribulose-bisphosphate carboxylase [Thermococcus thioreducens]KQH82910.1 ribulose 1,5-bisphosphate carboxylase [Thermococcus thioreducens]SEV81942.1 ribulose-1,5-bisphosphate carboxylase/oxygenase large subunit [Thermococcus thioreducens]